MDYQCKAESGLQLLARLNTRPNLVGLDEVLFSDGPNAKDIIEISGDPSSGKTLLLIHFLVKCLLPKQWQELEIGGLNAGAVIIDTDHHFQLLKLVNLMEASLIKRCAALASSGGEILGNPNIIEEIIKNSLKNLTILTCHDSTQLFVTFHSLEKILSTNTNISLLLLDSISAYYWQDTMSGGLRKMDLYLNRVLKMLCKCVQEYKIVVIYTKPANFQSKVREFATCNNTGQGLGYVTHRVVLSRIQDVYCANIHTAKEKKVKTFVILDDGIKWSNCSTHTPLGTGIGVSN